MDLPCEKFLYFVAKVPCSFFRENGTLILADNDWQDDPAQAAEITADGLAPTDAKESAIAATLPPGLYTAILAGANNGTGVGTVEVYDLGP